MLKFVKDNFSWVKDVGIVLFLVMVVWANSHYVTIEKFDNYVKANNEIHLQVNSSIALIDKTLALMQQNQVVLIENEKQISINTLKIAEHERDIHQLQLLRLDAYIQSDVVKNAETELRLKSVEKHIEELGYQIKQIK
jgi:hypothetical protein